MEHSIKRQISFEEQHSLLLEIAKAFDKVCRKNGIPYYMLGGTMLGAIRHKGFIPWDDDMDFGVPREYFDDLHTLLGKELPKMYRCRTAYDSKSIVKPFYKIEDTTTQCDNHQYQGGECLGINIDIFPLDSCCLEDKNVDKVLWLVDKYARIFTGASDGSKIKNFIKGALRFVLPFSKIRIYEYIVHKSKTLKRGDYLANLYGRWKKKEVVPVWWYGNNRYYRFEDYEFSGFAEYDKYLSHLYGDYMRIPPESQRTTHANAVYQITNDNA